MMNSAGLIQNELIRRAVSFHPWDALPPQVLAGLMRRAGDSGFEASAETGCGGSTLVLSQVSAHHTAFAIQGDFQAITKLGQMPDLVADRVHFVEGETKHTLPHHRFNRMLDLVILDGPHAYPMPQLEFTWLFPHLRPGGWLVIDDLQIPSVNELFRFLRRQRSVELEETVLRTAFFRKTALTDETGPDGWWLQGMNRRLVWKYSWRDRIRAALGRIRD